MAHRRYMYRSLCPDKSFDRASHLGKSYVSSTEFQKNKELKSVGNFVAKTVLIESAKQFSLDELCRTQYSLKYLRSHIVHQTV